MRYIPKSERLFVGQERVVSRFLFLPMKLNKEVRWLERVKIKQKVKKVDVGGSMEWGNFKKKWVDIDWDNS
ncbi:hypothetical protein JDW20_19360 [Bacillus subtilis]|uniref:hypothetical protein n=1 Tax=Bacillus subtilis TaxID=1423 RepID=UPI002F176C63